MKACSSEHTKNEFTDLAFSCSSHCTLPNSNSRVSLVCCSMIERCFVTRKSDCRSCYKLPGLCIHVMHTYTLVLTHSRADGHAGCLLLGLGIFSSHYVA